MQAVTALDVWLGDLRSSKEYFDRATRALDESDGAFAPADGMMSVTMQVAHVARTVEWLIEGLERPGGFDMDFDAMIKETEAVRTLAEARDWCARAYAAAESAVVRLGEAAMMEPLPAETIMGGMPKAAVIGALVDHTAHHRGALSVYTRLLGKVPPMPYMDI